MADEKERNTHVLHVVFDNGISVPSAWREQTRHIESAMVDVGGRPVPFDYPDEVIEGFVETDKYYEVRKADGTVERFLKERVVYYKIAPWKDLPESVKDRLAQAAAKASPHGAH